MSVLHPGTVRKTAGPDILTVVEAPSHYAWGKTDDMVLANYHILFHQIGNQRAKIKR